MYVHIYVFFNYERALALLLVVLLSVLHYSCCYEHTVCCYCHTIAHDGSVVVNDLLWQMVCNNRRVFSACPSGLASSLLWLPEIEPILRKIQNHHCIHLCSCTYACVGMWQHIKGVAKY